MAIVTAYSNESRFVTTMRNAEFLNSNKSATGERNVPPPRQRKTVSLDRNVLPPQSGLGSRIKQFFKSTIHKPQGKNEETPQIKSSGPKSSRPRPHSSYVSSPDSAATSDSKADLRNQKSNLPKLKKWFRGGKEQSSTVLPSPDRKKGSNVNIKVKVNETEEKKKDNPKSSPVKSTSGQKSQGLKKQEYQKDQVTKTQENNKIQPAKKIMKKKQDAKKKSGLPQRVSFASSKSHSDPERHDSSSEGSAYTNDKRTCEFKTFKGSKNQTDVSRGRSDSVPARPQPAGDKAQIADVEGVMIRHRSASPYRRRESFLYRKNNKQNLLNQVVQSECTLEHLENLSPVGSPNVPTSRTGESMNSNSQTDLPPAMDVQHSSSSSLCSKPVSRKSSTTSQGSGCGYSSSGSSGKKVVCTSSVKSSFTCTVTPVHKAVTDCSAKPPDIPVRTSSLNKGKLMSNIKKSSIKTKRRNNKKSTQSKSSKKSMNAEQQGNYTNTAVNVDSFKLGYDVRPELYASCEAQLPYKQTEEVALLSELSKSKDRVSALIEQFDALSSQTPQRIGYGMSDKYSPYSMNHVIDYKENIDCVYNIRWSFNEDDVRHKERLAETENLRTHSSKSQESLADGGTLDWAGFPSRGEFKAGNVKHLAHSFSSLGDRSLLHETLADRERHPQQGKGALTLEQHSVPDYNKAQDIYPEFRSNQCSQDQYLCHRNNDISKFENHSDICDENYHVNMDTSHQMVPMQRHEETHMGIPSSDIDYVDIDLSKFAYLMDHGTLSRMRCNQMEYMEGSYQDYANLMPHHERDYYAYMAEYASPHPYSNNGLDIHRPDSDIHRPPSIDIGCNTDYISPEDGRNIFEDFPYMDDDILDIEAPSDGYNMMVSNPDEGIDWMAVSGSPVMRDASTNVNFDPEYGLDDIVGPVDMAGSDDMGNLAAEQCRLPLETPFYHHCSTANVPENQGLEHCALGTYAGMGGKDLFPDCKFNVPLQDSLGAHGHMGSTTQDESTSELGDAWKQQEEMKTSFTCDSFTFTTEQVKESYKARMNQIMLPPISTATKSSYMKVKTVSHISIPSHKPREKKLKRRPIIPSMYIESDSDNFSLSNVPRSPRYRHKMLKSDAGNQTALHSRSPRHRRKVPRSPRRKRYVKKDFGVTDSNLSDCEDSDFDSHNNKHLAHFQAVLQTKQEDSPAAAALENYERIREKWKLLDLDLDLSSDDNLDFLDDVPTPYGTWNAKDIHSKLSDNDKDFLGADVHTCMISSEDADSDLEHFISSEYCMKSSLICDETVHTDSKKVSSLVTSVEETWQQSSTSVQQAASASLSCVHMSTGPSPEPNSRSGSRISGRQACSARSWINSRLPCSPRLNKEALSSAVFSGSNSSNLDKVDSGKQESNSISSETKSQDSKSLSDESDCSISKIEATSSSKEASVSDESEGKTRKSRITHSKLPHRSRSLSTGAAALSKPKWNSPSAQSRIPRSPRAWSKSVSPPSSGSSTSPVTVSSARGGASSVPLARKATATKRKVANCGPADYNYDETISTLRYANRAKNIKNNAKINEDPKDALLRQFQKEIDDLKKQLEDGGISGSGESGSEYESGEEVMPDGTTRPRKKKKGKGGKSLSKEKMVAIQAMIDADRRKLEQTKDMAEEEKRKVEEDLQKKEAELKKAQDDQEQLAGKLAAIEKKIIVGGENLLEKAEEQERLLDESAKELEERKRKEETLRRALEEKEQEHMDINEKYKNLQEEVTGKTKKLKKVWTMLMQAKSEIADLQQEHQREMEGLLENVRQLSRELHLQMMIIDNFIPPEYQEMIEQYVHWNEDIGEWQLKCVAYTGNNMRKQSPVPDKDKETLFEPDLSHVYLAYTAEGAEQALRPKTGKKGTGRPKTAASRPKSSKKKQRDDFDGILQ